MRESLTPSRCHHPISSQRDRRLRCAARAAGRGHLERALRGYLGLAREVPKDLQQLNRTGDLMVRTRQVKRGVELFLEVARGYERDGFEAKAIAIYRKILRIEPTQLAARQRLRALEGDQGLCS